MKDSIALNFMIEVLNVVKTEKGSSSVLNLLKKSGMDSMLTELFPTNKRGNEGMKSHFIQAGLPEIVTYLSSIENAGAKKELQRSLRNNIADGQSSKEIIPELRESVRKHGLSEADSVAMIWGAVMSAVEWNKKEDLLQEQVRIVIHLVLHLLLSLAYFICCFFLVLYYFLILCFISLSIF